MLFRKWNPPPLVPQVEQKDHKPHGGFELDPTRHQMMGESGGRSQDLKTKQAKVPDGKGSVEKRGGTGGRRSYGMGRTWFRRK